MYILRLSLHLTNDYYDIGHFCFIKLFRFILGLSFETCITIKKIESSVDRNV